MTVRQRQLLEALGTWDRFGRNFVRIRNKVGRLQPFVANRAQLYIGRKKAELVAQGRPARFLIPKARRMGVTTRETVVSVHRIRVEKGQWCATIAHRDEDVESVFDDQARRWFEDWRKTRPWFFPALKASNKREIILKDRGSRLFVGSGRSKGGGRGGTYQRVHMTEVAFAPPTDDFENQMVGYTEAASHGDVTCESTGNGLTGWFYEECMDALKGKSAWSMIFCPWFLMEEYADEVLPDQAILPGVPHDQESAPYVEDEVDLVEMAAKDWGIVITPGQLKWRRRKRRELRRNRKFFQEYPERVHDCFQGSSRCFFSIDSVVAGRERCRQPIHTTGGETWSWQVWHEPEHGVDYLAAADVAEGVEGGDYTYLTIHRRDTFEQVAAWHGWERPAEAGRMAVSRCREYNGAHLMPERNNHGHSFVEAAYQYEGLGSGHDGKLGWLTNSQTRPQQLDELAEVLETWDPPVQINDRAFWDECLGFVQQPNLKYEGNPDDRVMALSIAAMTRASTPAPVVFNLDALSREED